MSRHDMRALYVSHTGMTEALGRSQVMPYLRGLGRDGWHIDLVGFEPPGADDDAIHAVAAELAGDGIQYQWTRRSSSHALWVKAFEATRAFAALVTRALSARPRIIHARSYLPAASAQAAARLSPGTRFVFDCRGLLGDEYVDFGHWRRDGLRYRLLKRAERHLFGRADAVVVLTARLERWLREEARLVAAATPIAVVPCCVDLARFRVDAAERAAARARLGAGDRFVLAYAGNLGAWYCDAEMAALFAAIRRARPALFAVFTRAPAERLRAALREHGIADDDVRVLAVPPTEMPAWLAGADAAVSFAEPRFSKIASSPVKVAEYLAMGLPVAVNRGVGDQDALVGAHPEVLADAGLLGARELERAATRLLAQAAHPWVSARARALATSAFSLDEGVARYCRLYRQLAGRDGGGFDGGGRDGGGCDGGGRARGARVAAATGGAAP